MTPFRRLVALLLLFAVTSSSVEVLFGDRHAIGDTDAAQVDLIADGSLEGAALMAASSDSGTPTEDCTCLCACACAGAQLVLHSVGAALLPTTPEVAMSIGRHARSLPLHARRPPFRPPLV
jgi:hypothetical protein